MCFLPLLSEVSMKDVHARDSMERNSLFIHPLIKTNVGGWPKKPWTDGELLQKPWAFQDVSNGKRNDGVLGTT